MTAKTNLVTGAPEPGVGDTLLVNDSFEYADWAAMSAAGWVRNSVNVPIWTDGRNGGQAIRFAFTVADSAIGDLMERSFTETADIYFRYYFRHQVGKLPYCGLSGAGFKWFMPWHAGSTLRWTMGVNLHLTNEGPPGYTNVGYEFSGHDNQSSNMPAGGFYGNISKAIRFDTCNDGAWHKITYHLSNDPLGNSTGVGGYHQIWVDGVRLSDSRDGQPGVPAGGYTTGFRGIDRIQMPGLDTDGIPDASWEQTLDIDDLVIWHT